MTNPTPTCDHCGQPIHYATATAPGDYRITDIREGGKPASYGREAARTYTNIYVHIACLDAWHTARALRQFEQQSTEAGV